MQVDARPQQGIYFILTKLQCFPLKQFFRERLVEGTAKTCAVWHGKGDAAAVHTDTARPVRAAGNRNAERLQTLRNAAESACRTRRYLRGTHTFAPYHAAKILVRQLRQELFHGHRALFHIG